jgi:hypothetical protein
VGIAIRVGVGVGEALGVGAAVATLKHVGCQSPLECVSVSIMTAARTVQVRPSRDPCWSKQRGWEVFEAEGVSPVFCGENGREDALSYARQRAGYSPTEFAC